MEALLVFFFIVLVLGVFIVLVLTVFIAVANAKARRGIKEFVEANYKLDEVHFPGASRGVIGFNFSDQTVLLGHGKNLNRYHFSQIMTVEVVQNGLTLHTFNRGSQILGAVAGGALFGAPGAMIGGLSGSSISKTRVKSVVLKVVVENPTSPLYTFTFFKDSSKKGASESGLLASLALKSVERVHAQILIATRQAQSPHIQSIIGAPSSNLDTLKTLWELKEGGILSEEEFNVQKARILATNALK